jgi:hypothetical protein
MIHLLLGFIFHSSVYGVHKQASVRGRRVDFALRAGAIVFYGPSSSSLEASLSYNCTDYGVLLVRQP